MKFSSLVAAALAGSLAASAIAAAPPKVVETTPASGDLAVDPALKELRVAFDQAMDRRSAYSFVGGGESFPEITGQPRWLDERTIVLPIRLKPDHAYWLSINSGQMQGFKSTAGEPAVPHEVRFSTAGAAGAKPLTPQLNADSIEQLRSALRDRYSYRDVHTADWDKLFADAADDLKAAPSRSAFASQLSTILAHAGDTHITVSAGGSQRLPTHRPQVKPNFNGRLIPTLVPGFRKHNDVLFSGRFEDGTAYLMIASLEAKAGADADATIEALRGMADAPAVVLDLRPNGGGDEVIAQRIAGCFVEKPVAYAQHAFTDEAGGFKPVQQRTLQPGDGGPKLRQPVAVLMGPNNMSSAEAFVLMMRQVPQAKLFGGQTYGSSGNPQPLELANGVTVYLPGWKAMDAKGVEFEGKGLAPDVAVAASPQDLQKGDPVLQAAIEWLRSGASK